MKIHLPPSVPTPCDGLVLLPLRGEPRALPAVSPRLVPPLSAQELGAHSDAGWPIEGRFVFKAAAVATDWALADTLATGLARGLLALAARGCQRPAVLLPHHAQVTPQVLERLLGVPDLLRHDQRFLKTEPTRPTPPSFSEVAFVTGQAATSRSLTRRLPTLRATAEGVLLARRLVDTPPNLLSPEELLREARALGRLGVKVTSLPASALAAMGGVMAVGRGSANPPRFLVLELEPTRRGKPLVLVGKGVTFDSGGLSLKPPDSQETMKNDMAGAAAVLGAFSALARLGVKRRVIGLIPAVENMPDGAALRPGDVITMLDGKTVEVLNTDAEGRLILADALVWAQRYDPALVVDLATLTGAVQVALGDRFAGLFCDDPDLSAAIGAAAGRAGELLWPLPMHPLFLEPMKSTLADLKNSGAKRRGGACTAAAFLGAFAPRPFAHLDIAATAWNDRDRPGQPVGGTGYGVRTLVELVLAS